MRRTRSINEIAKKKKLKTATIPTEIASERRRQDYSCHFEIH